MNQNHRSPHEQEGNGEEFPPALRTAWDHYPRIAAPAHFNAAVFERLESRHNRRRGLLGACLRFAEYQIEGVALWRLALSGVGGVASVGLLLLATLGSGSLEGGSVSASPAPTAPQTPRVALSRSESEFYSRLWDEPFAVEGLTSEPLAPSPQILKPRPQAPRSDPYGGEVSWLGSKNPLV